MVDGTVGHHLMTLVLATLALSGCLGEVPNEESEGSADSAPDDAGPAQVFSPGWPDLGEAVVRPGVKIVDGSTSGDCTANFVFSTPDNHTLYLGTASHCLVGFAIGDPVSIAAGAVTGTLVYCSWGTVDESDVCSDKMATDEGWANDFALVAVPDEARNLVHPALLHWGGPIGILQAPPGANVHVLTSGNSSLRDAGQDGPAGSAADAREGTTAAPTTPFAPSAEWTTLARFAPPSIPGDSGSPVILADGTALGIMNAIITYEGANAVTHLSAAVAYLHNNTDLRIELKTYPVLADPIVPVPDEGALRRSPAE